MSKLDIHVMLSYVGLTAYAGPQNDAVHVCRCCDSDATPVHGCKVSR